MAMFLNASFISTRDQTRVRQVAEGLSSKRGLVGGWVVTL
jgi:hypothetical protein